MDWYQFHEFEQRVLKEPDLVLGWTYWNVLIPEVSGQYLIWLIQSELRKCYV